MAEASDFLVTVYDKALNRLGWVGAPNLLRVVPRANQQGDAELTLHHGDNMAGWLSVDGVRVTVHYRDDYVLGGPVRFTESKGAGAARTLTFRVLDDWRLWSRLLMVTAPSGTPAQQGADDVNYHDTGPAESVAKRAASRNINRVTAWGYAGRHTQPITVAPDLGRGDNITLTGRMVPIADPLIPLVDRAGVLLTVRQTLTGLTVDAGEPRVWPTLLSEDTGTLVANEWTLTPPEATAVLLAGTNADDTPRYLYHYDDVLEQRFGDVVERFEAANDLKRGDIYTTDALLDAALAARAVEYLAGYGVNAGLNLTLGETRRFTYGGTDGIRVGDRVRVELAPGRTMRTATGPVALPPVRVTDVLRSAELVMSADGVTATPTVGERSDPEVVTAVTMAKLQRAQRKQRAGG